MGGSPTPIAHGSIGALADSFCKRATNYRALLWKMTYKDKASYASSPPCTIYKSTNFMQSLCFQSIQSGEVKRHLNSLDTLLTDPLGKEMHAKDEMSAIKRGREGGQRERETIKITTDLFDFSTCFMMIYFHFMKKKKIHVCICVHVRMSVCAHARARAHVYVYMYVRACVYVCMQMRLCTAWRLSTTC